MPQEFHHHSALQAGHKLNVYVIERVIGRGGFGITYVAEDNIDRKVAIKEYLPVELAARETESGEIHPISRERGEMFKWGLEKFLDEAKTLAKFTHPNIVSILNYFEENGTAYVVMPYEHGMPLDEVIRSKRMMSESSLLAMLMPILDGLEIIHNKGLIHRDIKPANIYIRQDGSPVLLDFGAARQAIGEQTRSLTAILTEGFAPPEQYPGANHKQGPWTDIYALGATIYAAINYGKGPISAHSRVISLLEEKDDPLIPAIELGHGRYTDNFLKAIDIALLLMASKRPQTIAQWRNMYGYGIDDKNLESINTDQINVPTMIHKDNTMPAADKISARKIRQGISWKIALGFVAALTAGIYLAIQGDISGKNQHTSKNTFSAQTKITAKAAANNQKHDSADTQKEVQNINPINTQVAGTQKNTHSEASWQPPPKESPQESVKNNRSTEKIEALLVLAKEDLRNLRLTKPVGNNAIEKYEKILAIDPGNDRATSGIKSIIKKYNTLANGALYKEDFDKALSYVESALMITPEDIDLLMKKKHIEEKKILSLKEKEKNQKTFHDEVAAKPDQDNEIYSNFSTEKINPNDDKLSNAIGNAKFIQFYSGQIILSDNPLKGFSQGYNKRKMYDAYRNSNWVELTRLVISYAGHEDLSYYYMGTSSEGLGYPDAANKYYSIALKLSQSRDRCDFLFNNCSGLSVKDLASIGIKRISKN